MPISEDEFEHRQSAPVNTMGMTKAELRRSNKPIMEKKRRARINHCLNELKTLILDAMKKDPARHSKLEKADILEMTVKHLQTVQRQQLAVAVATDPSVLHKFKTGFSDCASEVSRYVGHLEGVEPAVKQRLVAHLTNCVSGLQQIAPFQFPGIGGNTPLQQYGGTTMPVNLQIPQNNNLPQTSLPPFSGDVNNNQNRIQMNGVQLIPSRLPTGELALVMPNSNNIPFFPPNSNFPTSTHTSAFSSVSRNTNIRPASPPLSPSSSVSSYEDSLTSDFPPATTPPLQIHINSNMTSSFPTPPSQSSNKHQNLSPQQALISSTTISPESKALEIQNKNNYNKHKIEEHMKIQYVNKKRPYPVEVSDRLLSVVQPPSKMMRVSQNSVSSSSSVIVKNENEDHHMNHQMNRDNVVQNPNNQPQPSNDMWRPW